MNYAFNGERLRKARIYRGLTVAELAEKVAQQRQTLSMYEIGKSQPSSLLADALAKALYFPKQFFYESPESPGTGTVYFRSLLTTSKKYRNEQMVKMDFLCSIYAFLQDYIEFPQYDVPSFPANVTPSEAAVILREAWGLGNQPLDNLVSLVEQHGILVTTFNTSTNDVDAFSKPVVIDGNTTFLIAYSSNKTSAARVHFDIAHELGHICLHEWSDDIEELTKEEFKAREHQAHEFAAAFLLPADSFGADARKGPASLVYYKQLKRKWKVSIAAMIRRAKELGIISYEDYVALVCQMQKRGQRKEEPLDDVLITASPTLLKTSVIMLLQENVFSQKAFMDELSKTYALSIYPSEIEFLLDLPSGTLAPQKLVHFNSALQIKKSSNNTDEC